MSNLLDNFISFFDPERAYKRVSYRKAMELQRSYDAASQSNRNKGWVATGSSANTETARAGSMLRNRSRELVRNNSYAKKANRTITNNVVGTGIKPSPQTDNSELDKVIKQAWADWAEENTIDYYGRKDFYSMQRLIMRTVAMSGECLVRRIVKRERGILIPLKYQILEPDYIDTAKDGQIYKGNEIRQGIEVDSNDKRVAYWLFEQHPGDNRTRYNLNSIRIDASEIIHIFEEERAGQLRGVPFGVSAMVRLRDLDGYEDAQLIRQKIAACFTAFVSNPLEANPAMKASSDPTSPDRLEPGRIEYLGAGETVTFGNPPESKNYEPYVKTVLRGIAAGFGVTYEAMTGDLSGVNFSSGRMGWLEFQRQLTDWQQDLIIPQFCKTVWADFMRFMVIQGKLQKPVKATWTPPRREMIDPSKEIKAMKEQVRNGFMSLPDMIQQLGGDPDVVMAEINKANKMLDKMGLVLDSDPRADANRIKQSNNQNTNVNEQEEE